VTETQGLNSESVIWTHSEHGIN